jgi:hypothetical protein
MMKMKKKKMRTIMMDCLISQQNLMMMKTKTFKSLFRVATKRTKSQARNKMKYTTN